MAGKSWKHGKIITNAKVRENEWKLESGILGILQIIVLHLKWLVVELPSGLFTVSIKVCLCAPLVNKVAPAKPFNVWMRDLHVET